MKNIFKLALCLVITVFLVGCASTTQNVPFPDQTKLVEDPNKARIYVVRPAVIGGAISMKVSDGPMLIGRTGPRGYLCWERDPGFMEVIGKAENTASLLLEVEKGMVYYIEQQVRMGILFARNKLIQLSEDQGKTKVSKCKPPKNAR